MTYLCFDSIESMKRITYTALAFVTGTSLCLAKEIDSKVSQANITDSKDTDSISLFNGKDLTGWSVSCLEKDRGKRFWSVREGRIVLDTKGGKDHDYMWLMTDQEFADFELTVSFKVLRKTGGNSGIQIRSRYKDHPKKTRWLHGPQVDIHPPAPFRTGLVYDETFETRRWISPSLPNSNIKRDNTTHRVNWNDGWNTLTIRAQGTKIKTWLNGTPVTDYDGKGVLDDEAHRKHNVGMRGHIALQLHSRDDVSMAFKNIRIKDLAP